MAKVNLILEEQPSEDRLFDMYFDNKMRTGETITGVVSIVSDPVGIDVLSSSFSGQVVQMMVSSGLPPDRGDLPYTEYKITSIVTTSTGQILENDGLLRIIEE